MKIINVLKRNYQLGFALVLVVFIPTALLLHNYFLVKKVKSNLDLEFTNKATLTTNVTKNYIKEAWPSREKMQERIVTVVNENKEIKTLDVLVPEGENFKIVASISQNSKGEVVENTLNNIAWKEGFITFSTNASSKSSIQELKSYDYESGNRYQMVVKTIKNEQGEKVALLSSKISLEQISNLTQSLIIRSYFVLGLIIIAILALIATNFKLFKQAAISQRLKEIDKMKDEFISIASHELRAPLTAVKGYAQFMEEEIKDGKTDNLKEYIDSITASTDRLEHLVEDILDVSRIEQNRIDIEWEEIKPYQVAKEVVSQFKFQAEEKGLSVYTQKPSSPEIARAVISADKNRFTQVIVNLVSNAVKYTPSGEVVVKLELDKEKNNILIKVRDTGIGMSAQERKKLFQKFSRIRKKENANVTGTGLGLWITQKLLNLQKGEIWVDSIEGEGSEFTVKMSIKKFEGKQDKKTTPKQNKKNSSRQS